MAPAPDTDHLGSKPQRGSVPTRYGDERRTDPLRGGCARLRHAGGTSGAERVFLDLRPSVATEEGGFVMKARARQVSSELVCENKNSLLAGKLQEFSELCSKRT
jgi:hypothetical protein